MPKPDFDVISQPAMPPPRPVAPPPEPAGLAKSAEPRDNPARGDQR
jgi:hypothetical protein